VFIFCSRSVPCKVFLFWTFRILNSFALFLLSFSVLQKEILLAESYIIFLYLWFIILPPLLWKICFVSMSLWLQMLITVLICVQSYARLNALSGTDISSLYADQVLSLQVSSLLLWAYECFRTGYEKRVVSYCSVKTCSILHFQKPWWSVYKCPVLISYLTAFLFRARCSLIEALFYKAEGRGFDSRWDHWIFQFT
jgi:hypothetical protein